jgi:hypothetical protein
MGGSPSRGANGTNVVRAPDGAHFCPDGTPATAGVTGPCDEYSPGAFRFALAMESAVTQYLHPVPASQVRTARRPVSPDNASSARKVSQRNSRRLVSRPALRTTVTRHHAPSSLEPGLGVAGAEDGGGAFPPTDADRQVPYSAPDSSDPDHRMETRRVSSSTYWRSQAAGTADRALPVISSTMRGQSCGG